MPKSSDLLFVSSNRNKYLEARSIAAGLGIRLGFGRAALPEVQSDSIREIAEHKARSAFGMMGRPVIVEDDGLFIDGLSGFPGPFSSYAFRTIGNDGILRLLKKDRGARFVSVISFCSEDASRSFGAELPGSIARAPRGDGWGYDPIFVPRGTRMTFAQLPGKNAVSHRFMAMRKFSSWYLRARESSGR